MSLAAREHQMSVQGNATSIVQLPGETTCKIEFLVSPDLRKVLIQPSSGVPVAARTPRDITRGCLYLGVKQRRTFYWALPSEAPPEPPKLEDLQHRLLPELQDEF